ncbi:hypothetical protein D9758_002151 [Tetrapyrgos nigripes]|uniref:Uncharacterized protein n=1 Tax=Tetrapyrgos nigripes TaxID=182062 RepID=A0A8H5GP61_9AGAR|nr:hypothetical protein D9758_002151 [Tetrapyrgos nigripes]
MSASPKGLTEPNGNVFIRFASFFIGSIGFGLSVLAALLHLVYDRPQLPHVVEHTRMTRSSSTRSTRKHAKQDSVSSSNAPTLVPSTSTRKHAKQDSVSSSNASTLVPSMPHSPSIDSKLEFQPKTFLQEKQILQELVFLVEEPKDELDTPTTLVDSSETLSPEEIHTDDSSRKKLCSCRAKDPSRKCLFRALRKAPSAPSSLSSQGCVFTSTQKKKSQPRLRTMPYDAPFFLPTPDSLPPRPTPSRSQTTPPPLPKVNRSQSMVLEKSVQSVETDAPRSPKHVTILLPPTTARRS